MKYYLLSNSVIILDNGNTYTISNDDYRFQRICNGIDNGDFAFVSNIVDPNNNISKEGFCIRNGLVYYKDEPLPAVIGDRFIDLDQNSLEFKSIFNFWFNIKTRVDSDQASSILQELVAKKAYAVTEDGFYLLYQNKETDQSKSVLNKRNHDQVFYFYNYANCPTQYFGLFDQKKNLNTVLEEAFGFYSKKLKSLAVEHMFKEDNNFINYNFLFFGEALKEVLANDNVFYVIENKLIDPSVSDINCFKDLNIFLRDYSIEKTGVYSQRKILNFLQGASNKSQLADIGRYYVQIKNNLNFDIRMIEIANNCEEIHDHLKREYDRIQNPVFFLNNDSEVDVLSEYEFDIFRVMIPQTNHDLTAWGAKLNNCLSTYSNQVLKKQCQIIGIADSKTNELMYAICIQNKTVSQFSGNRNSSPRSTDKRIITDFLIQKGLIFKE